MPRKLFSFALLVGCCLFAPALYACQDCFLAGETDPAGGVADHARCYSYNDGMWELCWPKQDNSGCTMEDTDPTACPVKGSGGGNTGGGGGTGTGGSTCSTRATGACPPDCLDCGGGGLLY
jgi:hypothetical protein